MSTEIETVLHCWACGHVAPPWTLAGKDADTALEDFPVDVCANCRCGRIRHLPDAERLDRAYRGSYYGEGRRKFSAMFQWLFDRSKRGLARRIASELEDPARARVLDIGCGTGQLLLALRRHGIRATGVERAGAMERAVDATLDIREGELGEQAFDAGGFDAVILWHVLEHLPSPADTLCAARHLLRTGGTLVLALPNNASWQARCFGTGWFHLDLPRHLHFVAHPALVCWLDAHGFDVRRRTTAHFTQNVFGFVQSALNLMAPRRPNRLYRLMRGTGGFAEFAELGCWLCVAALLAPLALLEWVLSGLAGAGASSIVFATRRADAAAPIAAIDRAARA